MHTKKPRRHDPCPCGSGKKYKQCCGVLLPLLANPVTDAVKEQLSEARKAVCTGDLSQAEYCFRQVLSVTPQQAEALAGLGQCLCWRQQSREGLAFLNSAAVVLQQEAQATGTIRPLIDLGIQLLHWGDVQAALELAETSVQLVPDNAAALNQLALCYSRMNRDKDALPHARSACQLLPDDPGCNILLAILDTRQGQLTAAKNRLEHVLNVCRDTEQSARAQLELGVVFDKLGDVDRAFAAFTIANTQQLTLPALQAIDAESIFTAINANQAGFDVALLQRWPVELLAADALPVPVFLFGFLRSGTTLTEQVLAAHPAILTSNEEPFIAELITELRRDHLTTETIPEILRQLTLDNVRHLRRFYWQRVTEKYPEQHIKKCFIDKMALNSIEAGLISYLFPEAKILFALRDPRDVCLSCYMQAFSPSVATINLLSWTGVAKQYAAVMGYWLNIRDALAPTVMTLRYEDTVNDFETTYRNVFDFLGVAWHADCAQFYTQVAGRYIATPSFSAVSQPLYKTAAGRWRNYEPYFPLILPQLQRFIEAFAYDKS